MGSFPDRQSAELAASRALAKELAHCPNEEAYRFSWAADDGSAHGTFLYRTSDGTNCHESEPFSGCSESWPGRGSLDAGKLRNRTPGTPAADIKRSPPLVAAAASQIGITLRYDPAYVRLEFPGGDVPMDRGVCSDVVIRALRDAGGFDLQPLVHEDMKRNFSAYPKLWGNRRPDPNIDHRRVPNLETYFRRRGFALPLTKNPADYLPGDLVACTVPLNSPHIMIVSNRLSPSGTPLVIHNIGQGVREEDRLFEFPMTGHYRIELPLAYGLR
jgi:uncharacterized protein YijF (DUF1287 family)